MISIRPCAPATDLDAVVRIEQGAFSRPWTRAMFERTLSHPGGRMFVACGAGGTVAGYLAAQRVTDELYIHTVAVDAAYRRQGIGRALVERALAEAAGAGAVAATLEVRRSNTTARALYEALGFRCEAVRPHCYEDPIEDALVYWRRPTGAAESG